MGERKNSPSRPLGARSVMRVRILREFTTATKTYRTGEVAEVDPKEAEGWLKAGLVMQDKSLDGASEVKSKRKVRR